MVQIHYQRLFLIISPRLCPDLQSILFHSLLPTETTHLFLVSPLNETCAEHFFALDLMSLVIFGKKQILKSFNVQVSSPCNCLSCVTYKYSPQHPVLKRCNVHSSISTTHQVSQPCEQFYTFHC